ncbi:uncharacterized protein DEA37_0008324 [Paragonimus westermani]|uniref:G-protein coupled receptors family 1 profile domain-containing protein n=1 Tax=Paragonimus westermani TaxID=34504 RepID=A0A5J4NJ49_9TREM|nr:uncharacterized protein DEA37_0008324 [Paragonimus westermani]
MWQAAVTVRVLLAVFGALATIINGIVFYVLVRTKIGSRLTTSLLRNQCVIDAYTGFIAFLYQVVGGDVQTGSEIADKIFCTIWYRDNLIWIGVILSVQNIVCISFDRYMAVLHPVTYKLRQKKLTFGMYIYISLNGIVMFYPNLVARRYANGRCGYVQLSESYVLRQFFEVEPYIWLVFLYILPTVFVIFLHARIVCYLRQNLLNSITFHQDIDDASKEAQSKAIKARVRKLTWTIMLMSCTLMCFYAYDEITYVLATFKLVRYIVGTPSQQAGVLLVILNSCAIPCILVSSTDPLYDMLLHGLCLRVGKLGDSDVKSAETTEYQ